MVTDLRAPTTERVGNRPSQYLNHRATSLLYICDGFYAALFAEGVVGEAINLGHSEPIEVRALIAAIEKALGKQAVIDWQPEKPGDMPITYANLEKAERLLNYRPQVAFQEGIREYVEWFREYRAAAVSV